MENLGSSFIVITTINPPTKAITEFSRQELARLIVVGDRKTPQNWAHQGADFISFEGQQSLTHRITDYLPVDHYARKMIGYLEAARRGADSILDTDDDNIPKKDWIFPNFEGEFDVTESNLGFINVYSRFSEKRIWPRGLPLDSITSSPDFENGVAKLPLKIGIWQGLADGEPDVDAIYRLVFGDLTVFDSNDPIVLNYGTWSPWNSQNTAISQPFFPLLYLPGFVSFRFTDILRSIVAQPILWATGHHIGFCGATVVQERNPHSLMKDFNLEISMYNEVKRASELCAEIAKSGLSVADNLRNCYLGLRDEGIVDQQEIRLLDAWLDDISVRA